MAFVADDLVAWLIGLLADAGGKKLTTLVLGTDQERELRRAATAAVRLTAEQLRPGDDEQAKHVALVISQVFRRPLPDAPTAGYQTVLGALQAGIAAQLAVLDDASMTGTDQSSADVLGVPGAVMAEKLTIHLLGEIVVRGSQGGSLAPLAAQLNHDLTHIQGERLESLMSQLINEVGHALHRGDTEPAKATDQQQKTLDQLIPVAECKPSWVGTHPAIRRPVGSVPSDGRQDDMPEYVPRDHDDELRQRLLAASAHGGLVVLVGGSSAGKTRSLFEAVRAVLPDWQIFVPQNVTAVREAVEGLPSRTIVWMDDTPVGKFLADSSRDGLSRNWARLRTQSAATRGSTRVTWVTSLPVRRRHHLR